MSPADSCREREGEIKAVRALFFTRQALRYTCCRGCTSSAEIRKIEDARSVAELLLLLLLLLSLLPLITCRVCFGARVPLYTLTYVSSCPIFTSKTVLNARASVSGEGLLHGGSGGAGKKSTIASSSGCTPLFRSAVPSSTAADVRVSAQVRRACTWHARAGAAAAAQG